VVVWCRSRSAARRAARWFIEALLLAQSSRSDPLCSLS
jgi:hypothetical protein